DEHGHLPPSSRWRVAAELDPPRAAGFPVLAIAPMLAIALTASASVLFLQPWQAATFVAVLAISPLLWVAFNGRWLPMFLAAVILLPPLPLALGDSGPHASILIAGIGVLVGLARLDSWRLEWSALNAAFALFIAALALSLGFAVVHSGFAIAAGSAARL